MAKKKKTTFNYEEADKYVDFHNEDPDLDTIRIFLPEAPDPESIINYGLEPAAQKFRRTEIPPKIKSLLEEEFEDTEAYWSELEQHYDYYKDELWFLDQEWERRLSGCWYYIKGKPYWFPGWYYMYLNYWAMDSETGDNRAEFRYRDLLKYLFVFCMYLDPYVLGVNYVKHRRDGATTNAQQINYEILTTIAGVNDLPTKTGIQSKTGPDAQEVFVEKFMYGVKKMPFFFLPIIKDLDSQSSLVCKEPKKSPIYTNKGAAKKRKTLNSIANWKTSTKGAYDGAKLRYSHQDEVGKTEEIDFSERWDVIKQCLTLGANSKKIGFSFNTSTVGEMTKGGGANLAKVCKQSHYGRRNPVTGQTTSGLVNLFIPAWEGLENHIDEWGFSLKEKAIATIMSQRKAKEDAGDIEGLSETIRQMPLRFREAFYAPASRARFNMHIINEKRTDWEINGTSRFLRYGKFEWAGDPKWKDHNYKIEKLPTNDDLQSGKAYVRFVETSKEEADWEICFLWPVPELANRFRYDSKKKCIVPANDHLFSHGTDMYRSRGKTSTGKASNGAGAIFHKLDLSIDNPNFEGIANKINPETGDYYWTTRRFCAIYNKKPKTKDEFCEQQLMAAIYFGCKTFPEMNITTVADWYETRGFIGYLFFEFNEKKGEDEANPGRTTTEALKDDIWNEIADHIQHNGLREHHPVLFDQCAEIDLDMGDYDVFTACGYALIAARSRLAEIKTSFIDIASAIEEFEY